ncbi:MAG: MetQ/NlpA family ABC transporter substrate-binding protein [Clostridia bacterium]
MKKLTSLLLAFVIILSVFAFGGCGDSSKTIKVGASPSPHADILEQCRAYVESKGFKLEIVEFDDYVIPNTETEAGSLDANYFQHLPYLKDFNIKHKTNLVSVLDVHFEPLGIYKGEKGTTLANLKKDDKIIIPDDMTNGARALKLLAANGVISITNDKGLETTVKDCDTKGLDIYPLKAKSIAAQLPEVAFAVINGNYAVDFKITDKVVASEDLNSEAAKTYGNVLVVKAGNEKKDKTQVLIDALSQQSVKDFITKTYGGRVVPSK